ncbi:hypothetical protein [Bradyrhizobium canariense]|uniref:Uncharacterized protein n=1 Tax=Bradyrhizobium canariense TaxID=255045 RepID=A0A1H1R8B2_9BRAD|nr:hypothetical protein [Bradyrhizobium canariense]SDS31129.1 hypothetical protein SAMN05444158_1662 [Bradyrhizobium canariense]
MTWTLWGLAIQTVAGVSDRLRRAEAGLVGGALSGAFLQTAAVIIVTGSGSQNPSTTTEIAVIHALTGAVAGAILMFAVGFLVHALRQRS